MPEANAASTGRGPRSLAGILTSRFFTLTLSALAVAGVLQVYLNLRIRDAALAGLQRLAAQEAQDAVRGFVNEKTNALQTALWIASPYQLSAAAQRDFLRTLLGCQPAIRRLLLLDPQYRVGASASRLSVYSVPGGDERRVREAGLALRSAPAYLSSVYIDSSSSEPLLLVALRAVDPVGAGRGALLAELNLKFMWDLLDRLRVGRTGYAYVVDRRGSLIGFGDTARVLSHENVGHLPPVAAFINSGAAGGGVMLRGYHGLRGTRVLGTYLPLGSPDWAVVVELPWPEAYGQTIRESLLVFALYLLLAALVSSSGIAVSRRLAAPLERLMQTAARIASGERGLQAVAEGPREVAALSRTFNSMTAQLQESLQELDRYFNDSLDLLCIAGTDGRFRRLSREWQVTLGFPLEQLEGRSFLELVHPDDRQLTLEAISTLQGQQAVRNFVNRYRCQDGSYRWIEWRSAPQGKAIFAVARDITERKRIEDEIRSLNESLEERVARRTAQLEQMNKELESFAYSISHDLRAPLRAINGYARLLSEDYARVLDEEGRRLCSVIGRETVRMDQLLESLLSFSRIGRSALAREALAMGDMVKSVYEMLTDPQARARVDLQLAELPEAVGDPALLRQVWSNLLSNALKFSGKAPRAQIRVEGFRRDKENVYSVRDNGAGFDMRYAGKLFGVFQRLHPPRDYEGNGIGLATVQRIIAMHGGRVWAEGEVGRGAVFSFSLPLRPPA